MATDVEATSAAAMRRPSRAPLGLAVTIAAAVFVYALVLLAHGLLPGHVRDPVNAYLTQGAIQCEHDLGIHAASSFCHDYGSPLGYALLTNGPVIMLGALAMHLPGVGFSAGYHLAEALVDLVALLGGYGLARRLGVGRALSVWAAGLYLISPTVVGMGAFVGTFGGFVLLPAYAFADLVTFDFVAEPRSRRRLALVAVLYTAVRVIALFLDGYSFVASAVVSVCLWAASARSVRHPQRRWYGLGLIVVANAIAYALYKAYSPGSFPPNPTTIFRALGLDLVTLVDPSPSEWLARTLHIGSDHGNLWGDDSNSAYNYVGLGCFALAVTGFIVYRRRPRVVALTAAGLIALVLALGPSVKINDARPAGPFTSAYYSMPSGAATIDLPWSGMFTALPGLKSMRASYRWFGVTRLALIMLAALGAQSFVRHRQLRVAGVAILVLATAELVPAFPSLLHTYHAQAQEVDSFQAVAGGELRELTQRGDRVFFLNYDGAHNDFLVNSLASLDGLRAYNAGGDKDALFAMQHWPPEIAALPGHDTDPNAVYTALAAGGTDVIIAPYFHLGQAYAWPPSEAARAQVQQLFAAVLHDPRFRVQQRHWMAALRLRGG